MAINQGYFVLQPKQVSGTHEGVLHAQASRRAMRTYANVIEACDPALAHELRQWADKETPE